MKAIGAERMAALVRRSVALAYKWENPTLAVHPSIEQALALDSAYLNDGHGPPPFLISYAIQLRELTARSESSEHTLADAAQLVARATDVLRELARHTQAPQDHSTDAAIESLRSLGEAVVTLRWKLTFGSSEAFKRETAIAWKAN
jgi:hypothetical protein